MVTKTVPVSLKSSLPVKLAPAHTHLGYLYSATQTSHPWAYRQPLGRTWPVCNRGTSVPAGCTPDCSEVTQREPHERPWAACWRHRFTFGCQHPQRQNLIPSLGGQDRPAFLSWFQNLCSMPTAVSFTPGSTAAEPPVQSQLRALRQPGQGERGL